MLGTTGSSRGFHSLNEPPEDPVSYRSSVVAKDRDREEARVPGSCCGHTGLFLPGTNKG